MTKFRLLEIFYLFSSVWNFDAGGIPLLKSRDTISILCRILTDGFFETYSTRYSKMTLLRQEVTRKFLLNRINKCQNAVYLQKRQLENNKWTAKERMSILGANVTSIYATDKLLYVARNDGITEKIDLETWQKLEAERLTSSSIVFAGICVDTDAETDPSEYTSVCSGNTDCDEFCFDVNDQVVCYCEHESKQVNISENCPG